MCSELFRIPMQWQGTPLMGFGVVLAIWLVAAGCWAAWQWVRPQGKKQLYDLLPLFGIVTGAIIALPWFAPAGVPIRGYGVMLVLASGTGLAMAVHRAALRGMDADTVLAMVFGMFVLGIAGARLFFVIQYSEAFFGEGQSWAGGLRRALLFTEGGLVVYGSLIGGAVAFVWFCVRRSVSVLAMADVIAPSLVVGLAIGRIGCLLNGCCYGGVCDRPWAVTFPAMSAPERMSPPFGDQLTSGDFHGFHWESHPRKPQAVVTRVDPVGVDAGLAVGDVITHVDGRQVAPTRFAEETPAGTSDTTPPALGDALRANYADEKPVTLRIGSSREVTLPAAAKRDRSLPVHPTQVYSAVHAALLGWFLWLWYPLRRRDGEVIGLLLTIYPVGRFMLEIIRTDEPAVFRTGLSISQNVSLVLLAGVAFYWVWLLRRPAGTVERLGARVGGC